MSEFKGTPGPWCFDKRDGEIYSPKAYTSVAVVLGSSEGDANGKLIEAAPDLLECLIELRQWISQEIAHPNSPCGRADTAIAKALGEDK